jgi:hypothetical protein
MSSLKTQSSRDVSISINGTKVAAVFEYKVQIFTENKLIESIFQSSPLAIIPGKTSYTIEISRFLLIAIKPSPFSPAEDDNPSLNLDPNSPASTEEPEAIDFYGLQNFDFIISKPDQKIVYSGCEWKNLQESTSAGKVTVENAVISARTRTVIKK